MMNSLEFAGYINERADNMGVAHVVSDKTIGKMQGFMQNPYSAEFPGVDINANGDDWASTYYNQYANTDWFQYYFKDKYEYFLFLLSNMWINLACILFY